MDHLLDALARLNARMEILERRIDALEQASQAQASQTIENLNLPGTTPATDDSGLSQAGGAFPVVGKAMLGIAGAYLLRAVAESGSFPKLAVVGLALAYAGMWLVWAARVPLEARFARTAYAATSALILTPMLWELTLRFQFLSAAITAVLLTAFVVASAVISWKHDLAAVMWVAVISAVLSTLGLLVATYDPVPFVTALVVIAGTVEIAAYYDHTPALRPLVAMAADLAICTTLYIYASPESVRSSYAAVSAGTLITLAVAWFAIYVASISLRAVLLERRLSTFEIGQAVFVFVAAAFPVIHFSPVNGIFIVGTGCILLSATTYVMTFVFFDRAGARNYHVFATWSLALLLTGSFFTLPAIYLALCLGAVAIVATVAGCRTGRLTLEFHGLVYLVAAAFASSLLSYAGRALAGTFPTAPGWLVWSVAAAAVICYAIGGSYRGERWPYRLLELLSAMLAVSAVLTFLVSLLVWVAALGMSLASWHVAVIRTLITCSAALALSFAGSRWQRIEFIWIAYGMLALVTAKLLFEDIRQGHPATIAISIFLYAVALITIPRAARLGEKARRPATAQPLPTAQSAAAK